MINSLASLKELVIKDCEVTLWGPDIATEFACPRLEKLHLESTDVLKLGLRCPMLSVLWVHEIGIDFLDLRHCPTLSYLDTNVDCVEGGESVTHLICRLWAVSENHLSGRFPNMVNLSLMQCCNFEDGEDSLSVITLDDLPSLKTLTVDDYCMSHYIIKHCPVLNITITHPHAATSATVLHSPDSHHILWTSDEV